jgi:hypothetical protein
MLMIDLQEAMRLSRPASIPGLEALETSGHWTALDELSQRMLQKVHSLWDALISGTISADEFGISTRWP